MSGRRISLAELGVENVAQLPDWVFGERVPVLMEVYLLGNASAAVLSQNKLPDPVMIWQIGCHRLYGGAASDYIRLGFVPSLPADEQGFMGALPVMRDFGRDGADPRAIQYSAYLSPYVVDCRRIVSTGGGHLAMWYYSLGGVGQGFKAWVVYSAVPKELPLSVARMCGFWV